MSVAQVLRQAEALKATVTETGRGSTEAWVSRQDLQDTYQKLLVMDLEYALDKKVEQDLWNHAFKNQINTMQSQVKDKQTPLQNPKRPEIQASLNLFLETASGFYIQLLQELCSAFKLDLPFRRKSSSIGILKEYGPVANKIRAPKKSSCMYICQHCLVHLGDIARYRQQIEQAQTYYRHAAQLVPSNGQPYNQLAILEAAKGNKLSTVYYYVRSIAVKHPFPVASTNLEKFFAKISRETLEIRGKLSMSEIVASFLQMHAFLHLCTDLSKAKQHMERLISSLPTHITSMSFSSYQLLQMVSINLFALHHARRKLNSDGGKGKKREKREKERDGGDKDDEEDDEDDEEEEEAEKLEDLAKDERTVYDMIFKLTVSMFDMFLHHTPKQETKAKEYHTLPGLKVILDWLHTDRELLSNPAFKTTLLLWPTLSKLLNNLQFHANQKEVPYELEKYQSVPLPEDCDLQCFTPLQKVHGELDFRLMPPEGLFVELEMRLRCHRIVAHGLWICDEFPSLNLLNAQKLKSGKIQFSAPTPHIKVIHGSEDGKGAPERRSVRTNVAIQAIMQNKAKKSAGDITVSSKMATEPVKTVKFQAIASPAKSDAGIMAHASTDPRSPGGPQMTPISEHQFLGTVTSQVDDSSSRGGFSSMAPSMDTSPLFQTIQPPPSRQPVPHVIAMRPEKQPGFGMASEEHNLQGFPGTVAPQSAPNLPYQMARGTVGAQRGTISMPPPSQQQVLQSQRGRFPPPVIPGMGRMPGMQPPPPPQDQHSSMDVLSTSPSMRPRLQLSLGTDISPPGGLYQQQQQQQPPTSDFSSISNTFTGTFPQDLSPTRFSRQISPEVTMDRSPVSLFPKTPGNVSFRQPRFPIGFSPNVSTSMPAHSVAAQLFGPGQSIGGMENLRRAPSPRMMMETGLTGLQGDAFGTDARDPYDRQAPSDSLLTQHLQGPRMPVNFSLLTEEVPKPDSPPTVPGLGSLFSGACDTDPEGRSSSGSYSLFTQSPWSTIQLNKADSKSLSSSPFGSSGSSSLRATPDLFNPDPDRMGPPPQPSYHVAAGMGYNRPPSSGGGGEPPVWGNSPVPPAIAESVQPPPAVNVSQQPLWSSGPSPLERLLEQQKQQHRQNDPH